MIEVWKDIDGYEGLYQVSTLGNVKSLGNNKTRKEKILQPKLRKDGYLAVGLHKEGKIKEYTIHRLVAKAFIPNPFKLPYVNHKNEDKTLNVVWNLEWSDAKYNANYGTRNKRIGLKLINRKDISRPVYCLELNKIFLSTMEAERITGAHHQHITACLKGRYKSAGGYSWRYIY